MVDADPTFLFVYKRAYNGLPKYQFVLFPADLLMKSCDALMALKLFSRFVLFRSHVVLITREIESQ